MGVVVSLNYNRPQTPSISTEFNYANFNNIMNNARQISNDLISNQIQKSVYVNNTPKHISFNDTIEYNETNSYIEGKIIDMKAESEIKRIFQVQKGIYLSFFIISVLGVIMSWVPALFREDVSLVLKPLSIAFPIMIGLHYHFGRAR